MTKGTRCTDSEGIVVKRDFKPPIVVTTSVILMFITVVFSSGSLKQQVDTLKEDSDSQAVINEEFRRNMSQMKSDIAAIREQGKSIEKQNERILDILQSGR